MIFGFFFSFKEPHGEFFVEKLQFLSKNSQVRFLFLDCFPIANTIVYRKLKPEFSPCGN